MFLAFFHAVFYNPLYNGLVFLIGAIPGIDLGVAVIIFTIIVRLILFPLSRAAVVTQFKMKEIEPELKKIKEQHANNKEEQAKLTMKLYSDNKINPFSSLLLVLIQLPILIALYMIFRSGFPKINASLLYSYVHVPSAVNIKFLGLIDVTKTSVVLGIVAGVMQFFQTQFSIPKAGPKTDNASFSDDLARSVNFQMRFVLPIFIFLISLRVAGAVDLYYATTALFTIGQELYMRKRVRIKKP
jgi:YidC/Oxa1 family membrane protein insertase